MKYKNLLTRKFIVLLCLGLFFFYIIIGFYNPLTVTEYSYTSSKVPAAFDGYRITQISDFHCRDFGKEESDLIQAIRDTHPDIIVFTGDSIDDEHPIDNYAHLLEGIHDIAPIYYINGNHEYDKLAPLSMVIVTDKTPLESSLLARSIRLSYTLKASPLALSLISTFEPSGSTA